MTMYKVEICGVNTSKLPLLSTEEKERLFERIKQGDSEAREEYIRGNLRLVLSIIQRFNRNGECVDDLFQIGCIGLMKAIDHFDTTQGVKFSTYAVPMIIGEIRRYLRDNNAIRISRSIRDIAYKAMYAKEQFVKEFNREPTIRELTEQTGLTAEEIEEAFDAMQTPMSLDEPVYRDSGDAFFVMDQICDKKNREEEWVEELSLKEAMKRLSQREKRIIDLRFFHGKTQMEVAKQIQISQAQVSRLEKNALQNMRGYLSDRKCSY